MAIKYVKEGSGRGRPPRSYNPPGLFGSGGADGKRRFLFIYVAIGAAVFALSITNIRDRADTFENRPTLRGAALVTAKQNDGALVLQVGDLPATYTPDAQTFQRLKPGDRVAVLYQRSRNRRQIKILEIGTAPIGDRL
ncbi:MAG: hypothetical protein NTZ09_11835 [Candidatus Hydrogenedentes bacterium]|nr:hypothetical protein [Candidatus Hydrogenedentota bacterium]